MTDFAIEARNVSVRFDGVTALEDIDLAVEPGAYVSIIGPNGSGKSTLINTLLGIQSPTTGTATLFGKPPRRVPANDIGYLPQIKTLDRTFPAVALELVVSGLHHAWPWRIAEQDRRTARDAMERTGVADLEDRPIRALSGGELQRVYLARSLVHKPKLLLLDEPAAGMDVAAEAGMYHLLEAYQRETGATVVMVTHDWEGAREHATHALLLNRRQIAFGPARETAQPQRLLEIFGHVGHIVETHGEHADA